MILALFIATAEPADCGSASTIIEERTCASDRFARADSELNRVWRATMKFMEAKERKRRKPVDGKPSYTDALGAAQRAWSSYRDKHCNSASFAYRGGSGEQILLYDCLERVTRERITQLNDLREWYEF